MKALIFVREGGGKYEGGHFGGQPVELEALPRAGDYVAHPDVREWLRVNLVAVTVGGKPHELYTTKVDQRATVEDAQRPDNEDDVYDQLGGR